MKTQTLFNERTRVGYKEDRINEYRDELLPALEEHLLKSLDRYPSATRHLNKISEILDQNESSIRLEDVSNFHNEICVVINALEAADAGVTLIDYEPKLTSTDKSIDLRVNIGSREIWVDIKTIRPDLIDRWKQFIETRDNGRIPESVTVSLDQKFGGGEIWHSMFASRARMLEYTCELETKIADANLTENSLVMLMCCGDGNRWQEDELEDFVQFYRTGQHRKDDAFALMESHFLESEGLSLQKTITSFGVTFRNEEDLLPKHTNWNVQAPNQLL